MIGKIISMNRVQRRALRRRARSQQIAKLRDNLFALTRYIVDADPYGLIVEAEQDILSLSDYALAVEAAGIEPGEKVEAFGVRNLHGEDLADWQAEMLAVAARAHRMASPVIHIILSLKEGEIWTADEREEAITIIVQTLGLERCQLIWAEHSNTENAHLHLSVVRVDPATGQAAGTDWLIDDLHQALALIEERQGRVREPNALYVARGGAVYDADTQIMVRDAAGRYHSDWYKALGKKHDRIPASLRPKRARIIAAVHDAGSWSQLHVALEELEVTYDRSGSGARIGFGEASAKASEVHPSLSRCQLEQRLGAFEPDLARLDSGYEAYYHAFEVQLAGLRQARAEEGRRLDQWVSSTLAALPPEAAKTLGPAVRAEADAAKASLAEAFKQAIARCTKNRLSAGAWAVAERPTLPPPVVAPALLLPAVIDGVETGSAEPAQFERRQTGWATEYRLGDGTPLFTDHRIIIVVHATDHAAGIDEALKIAAERWGTVTVRGPEAFLDLVAVRAEALGISVVDADAKPLLPVKALSAETGRPGPAHAQPAGAEKTFVEDDPVRRARIDAAIETLRKFPGLPLRRLKRPEDTPETGNRGKLEIVLDGDRLDWRNQQLAREAIFDDDPRVQTFLKEQRNAMLDQWRVLLLGVAIEPADMSPESLRDCLPRISEIRYPAFLAKDDGDFMNLMKQVREQLLNRNREAARRPSQEELNSARALDRSMGGDKIPQQQCPVEETAIGVSIQDQSAWQEGRRANESFDGRRSVVTPRGRLSDPGAGMGE